MRRGVQAKQWEDAVAVLRVMTRRGVLPNVYTYTTLMKACTSAGAVDAAIGVFQMMETNGVCADLQAYNSLMAAFARVPDWQQAWAVLGSVRRAGLLPDIVSYNTLLTACERCARPRRLRCFPVRPKPLSDATPAHRPCFLMIYAQRLSPRAAWRRALCFSH